LSLEQARRFHYLYERTSAGLVRIMTFSSEPEIRRYLENLVARAYSEIQETRETPHRLSIGTWFLRTLPQTFRRHVGAFWLSLGITIAGVCFGGFAVALDPEAKEAILPEMFANHMEHPSERVAREERSYAGPSVGRMTSFSAQLMVNNIRVSITALAFGMSFGIGTIIVLFYNGVILGVVIVDYVLASHTQFLLGWLLPHGAIEIPAVLMAGQGGLVLAGALIGWGKRDTMTTRLRAISHDLVTLIFGVAILLVWAGLVEAFLSQYHEPVLPYWVKIAFGVVELGLLALFLGKGGGSMAPGSRFQVQNPVAGAAAEEPI
jgi:uncharacterized membrane protein SpoIIM required for sporulation